MLTFLARRLLAFFGLLAFALWLPVIVASYLPGWHSASCDWNERCSYYGSENAQKRITELRDYMQHGEELPDTFWSVNERKHLAEVRTLLDRCWVIALLGALIFFHADARERVAVSRAALVLVVACVLVLPFFRTFWREVFHPLLFSNNDWMMYPEDTSYWVMPRLYFQYTTGMVIAVAAMICAGSWLQARRVLRP